MFKKKKEPEFNFSTIGTDMHSHIIPGIDDGAKNINDSLALAKRFKALGFKKLVTTPHVMADYYRNTPETIQKGLDILREGLQKNGIDLEVDAAAEYYLDETFENKIAKKNVLTFGQNFLLFELSFINPPHNLFEAIAKMQDAGYQPVLAHPERYPYYQNSLESYEQIRDTGCMLQLNTISLTGYYGKSCKQAADELVDNHCIDFLGSDMHHLRHADALKESLYVERLQNILSQPQLNNLLL
ncbi:CpsB/CapC family capsule biosynthesis tyrosine phosphatase [Pedobacter sp. KR3-3]|uniref:protein-tyrosine-phosphatase n=1 Tax=Pedobacter albus TaxID=3113905 RepID=A0ABU7ICJ4_9SPHI|nr:CpsB/CapC family capsule biosynthesis tyrosine phosphatase [Pedobacter sp. KR3-3]MEE1947223.1 CpsB/CapC family capsule biosynthesis tyrosine phosphatase [Pedobacter sp. KR3-3]